jgi:hypothetical protein
MVGDQRVEWLAYITFFGAAAASIGGILFGWLSDRSQTRRPWIVAGLIGTLGLMMCVPLASRPIELLLLVVVWQLALNMMLGPLSAWAADHVPSGQLGSLGGLLAPGDFTYASGVAATERLLDLPKRATAIIASNDRMVLAGLAVARERGFDVPRDLSLVSFDNTPVVRFTEPPLTAVDQPVADIVALAVEMIIRRLRRQEIPQQPLIVEANLVQRNSTAPPLAV